MRRWERCIYQQGGDLDRFFVDFLGQEGRRVLLVAGAGFDPRSVLLCERLAGVMSTRIHGLFLREERPSPSKELVRRAESNVAEMKKLVSQAQEAVIRIFAQDGAVIGGRGAVQRIQATSLNDITDVIVDLSALSKGVSFPIVKQLLQRIERENLKINLHLMVANAPHLDDLIRDTGSDKVGTMHGFKGRFSLAASERAAKLWLPQLTSGHKAILDRIFNHVEPHDVLPILPFPARDPRMADRLIEEYADEFTSVWDVDTRNIVYTKESMPLDLYRTILHIHSARERVFAQLHGSLTVLSPIGSKVVSIGALMAALECDFPIVYVETFSYDVDFERLDLIPKESWQMVHIWLYGEAYAGLESNGEALV